MQKKRYLIITIDTEGDNLWAWKKGDEIKTENTLFLNRFQTLCDKYTFKPVWLTNWEMINDPRYVDFIKKVEKEKRGELGMHLHAWNTPPIFELEHTRESEAAYLIEYPESIMEEKIKNLTQEIVNKTGIMPTSHRAGRWAVDKRYLSLLEKYGYTVDTSVTPHIDWSKKIGESPSSRGADYTSFPEESYFVSERKTLLEVPLTIIKSHKIFSSRYKSIKGRAGNIYHSILGDTLWLRPDGRNLSRMLYIVDKAEKEDRNYIAFMLHSSELMCGGSPTFKTEEDIEKLYSDLEALFKRISKSYEGITLRDYRAIKEGENG